MGLNVASDNVQIEFRVSALNFICNNFIVMVHVNMELNEIFPRLNFIRDSLKGDLPPYFISLIKGLLAVGKMSQFLFSGCSL